MTNASRPRTCAAAVLAFVLLLGVASCGGDDGPGPTEARVTVDGSATVIASDGTRQAVSDSATLSFGDVLVVDTGTATLALAAGQTYEFRAGDTAAEVLVEAPPTLRAGEALVTGGFPAGLRYETSTVAARGPLQLDATVPAARSYGGGAEISGTGALERLPALRQVVLTSSAVPEPLEYDAADRWDRRFLLDAITLGEQLENIARGYTSNLRSRSPLASFYESVLPALAEEREFGDDLVQGRAPGEVLVGAAITVQGQRGTFRERWESVFAFRDAGAAWGIVALDQGVSSGPVLDTVQLAISGPAPAEPAPVTTTTPPPPTTTVAVDVPPSVDPTTTTTTVPQPTPPPPPEDGLLTPLLTPVEQLLDDVLGAIGLD